MLLRYIDELAQSGQVRLNESDFADVRLLEPVNFREEKNKSGAREFKCFWKTNEECELPREMLFYDDTDDGSNALYGTWQKFAQSRKALKKCNAPTLGGSGVMKNGLPIAKSMIKCAIYLRYSQGYHDWLKSVDPTAIESIQNEIKLFTRLIEKPETLKLPVNWCKLDKIPRNLWALPVVSRSADGRAIVLGLQPGLDLEKLDKDDYEEAEKSINLEYSIKLSNLLNVPAIRGKEVINGEFHVRSGLGRNAFGEETKPEDMRDSEYGRLLGPTLKTPSVDFRKAWSEIHKVHYRVKITPFPLTSELLFFPEGQLAFADLRKLINEFNMDREKYFSYMKKKRESKGKINFLQEENPEFLLRAPDYIPALAYTTVVAVAMEGSTKKKRTLMGVYPSVNMRYWSYLNREFIKSKLEYKVTNYSRAFIAGHESASKNDPPSVYRLWTDLYTQSLQGQFISILPFWNFYQRYCKAFSRKELLENNKGSLPYLNILKNLRRLQHIIGFFRTGIPKDEALIELDVKLKEIETGKSIIYGVIDPMKKKDPLGGSELLGENYSLLWENQKRKIDEFIRLSWQGIPEKSYLLFIKGALVGMLLTDLEYWVKDAGRRFEASQGRHPSTLRGDLLPGIFSKGIGLLQNLNKEGKFNRRLTPFIISCVPDSRKDAFNNGLIMGMGFIPTKVNNSNQDAEGEKI